MTQAPNPYAPPIAEGPPVVDSGPNAELEAIRRVHLSSETNIKSIGSLAILGAILQLVGAVTLMSTSPVGAVVQMMLCGVMGATGISLRKLLPWGRNVYSVMLALSLAAVVIAAVGNPAGAGALPVLVIMGLVSALFMWVLWNAKAKVVFSEHYREVVLPATPHIKYKTSMISIVVLIVLLAIFVAIIVAALMS